MKSNGALCAPPAVSTLYEASHYVSSLPSCYFLFVAPLHRKNEVTGLLRCAFSLVGALNPEDLGNMFLRNVGIPIRLQGPETQKP
jgi:hypothetical protein